MQALRLETPGGPLRRVELALPLPAAHQVRIAVEACGVCRTDLHLLDGELPAIPYPLTPGHEIVGRVVAAGPGRRLGLYGFGAAAHLLAQVARAEGREVFAFTRPGDEAGQAFARTLGAVWAGGSDQAPPEPLEAAILFAPLGALVPAALAAVRPGGRVVCAGIHMSDIPAFPYRLLWGERQVCSVANLTREDGEQFLPLAARLGLRASVECFALEAANEALGRLRAGQVHGAAVLVAGGLRAS